jgi:hypothetical protein
MGGKNKVCGGQKYISGSPRSKGALPQVHNRGVDGVHLFVLFQIGDEYRRGVRCI